MIRLLYISTARNVLPEPELGMILQVSRRNNQAVNVTGLLVVGGRRFLQALEGPEEAVMATFERIRVDPRHFAVVVLGRTAIDQRQFGSWSMGYQPGNAPGAAASVADEVASLIAPIADPNVHAYFEDFARRHAA